MNIRPNPLKNPPLKEPPWFAPFWPKYRGSNIGFKEPPLFCSRPFENKGRGFFTGLGIGL